MCGIAGYFGVKPPCNSLISRTLELMKRRGPDHQASKAFTFGNNEIRLLHSRLSIIDLDSRSNQPFSVGPLTIVFNGEIYNYLELRKGLLNSGVQLLTSSDTEVLLHYYRIHGKDCLSYFEGMWSLAIFDSENGTIFISRDRFGEKPLYFMKGPKGLFFGSEIKFIKSLYNHDLTVNRNHVRRHLAHGYKSLYKTNETYFLEIRELTQAHNLTYSMDGLLREEQYWFPHTEADESMTLEDSLLGTREHLLESVRIRLRADVPLAFCLSGGVDSASLASIATKEFNAELKTFSIIDSDERYNEKDNILATVRDLGCAHNLISIPQHGSLERLKKLIHYHDAPLPTLSSYVYSLICESVSDQGYRVSFSGNSADELFTGYYDHFVLHLNELKEHSDYPILLRDWETFIKPFVRNPYLRNPRLYQDNPSFRNHVFDASEEINNFMCSDYGEKFTEKTYSKSLLRNRMLNELFHESTPVILHEDDLNSMYFSVENRSPFLDSKLQKFAYSIPAKHLIRDGFGKFTLRESMKGILNEKVRLDRSKKGFNISINSMVDFKDSEFREQILDESSEIFEIVDYSKIKALIELNPLPNHYSKFLFNFINAKIFLEMN